MTLSAQDLSQMDTDYLDDLPEDELRPLSKQLLADLKEARERLKQSSDTSSRPPSSREPWQSNPPCGEPLEDASAMSELAAPDSTVPSADGLPSQDSAPPPAAATGDSGSPKQAGCRRLTGVESTPADLAALALRDAQRHRACRQPPISRRMAQRLGGHRARDR